MNQREELIQLVRQGAVPPLSYEVAASIAEEVLGSEWLNDIKGEAWDDGWVQGYDAGFDAGQDDGFTKGAHINESKTFVS